jgi:hypothetical protein
MGHGQKVSFRMAGLGCSKKVLSAWPNWHNHFPQIVRGSKRRKIRRRLVALRPGAMQMKKKIRSVGFVFVFAKTLVRKLRYRPKVVLAHYSC